MSRIVLAEATVWSSTAVRSSDDTRRKGSNFMLTAIDSNLARIQGLASLVTLFALAAMTQGCAAEQGGDSADVESNEASIVGGTPTAAFPAVGALTDRGFPFCTGTVVAPRVVVTAAHCLTDGAPSTMRFAIGPNANAPTASVAVARIIAHSGYNADRLINDIGVVLLAEDAPVTPIPMNTATLDASWMGRKLTFVGYGVTNGTTQVGAGVKRQASIPIAGVKADQFSYKGPKNTCFGDSGGPALAEDASGAVVVAGVTSYGDEKCTRFGVDTRVDMFQAFVRQAAR